MSFPAISLNIAYGGTLTETFPPLYIRTTTPASLSWTATVYAKIESKDAVVLTWVVPNDWKWPIASPPIEAFARKWRLVLARGKLWLQYYRGVESIRIAFAFFIEKIRNNGEKVIISRSHIKLKERRGHGFMFPPEFAEATELRVNCRVIELAALLKEKS